MKKVIITLLLLIFPFTVSAIEVNYDVTNYHVEAHIQTNGDMKVKEWLVIDGSLNGYQRDIYFKSTGNLENIYDRTTVDKEYYSKNSHLYQATDIKDIKISSYLVKNNQFVGDESNYSFYKEVNNATTGNSNVFEKLNLVNGYRLNIYVPTNNQKRVFYIEYTIKDVVVLHEDTAELNWIFVGSEFDDTIRDIKVNVYLPGIDDTENFKFWAYGTAEGTIYESKSPTTSGFEIQVNKLKSKTFVEARTLFKSELLDTNFIKKRSNEKAFDKIVEIEENKAEIINAQIKKAKLLFNGVTIISAIYGTSLIAVGIYIYIKYDKEHKSTFDAQYYREFIEDYDVEVIDYLMKKGITENAMSASIMNLIYKKNIDAKNIDDTKEYEFNLLSRENLSDSEIKLVDFLFTIVGDGSTFTTKGLKKYAKSERTYSKFTTNYTNWKNKVISEAKKQQFYESTTKAQVIGGIYLALGIGLMIINMVLNIANPLSIIALVLGVIFFIYTVSFNRRTLKGNEHYNKWKAFKNFLNDFGTFKEKELPEIVLWERYLVYATIFGLASKVQKTMNVKIKEYNLDSNTSFGTDFWIHYHMHSAISRSINSTVSSSIRAAQSAAVQAARTTVGSSGGGGGFSGGGGFGGGGGGGRGF